MFTPQKKVWSGWLTPSSKPAQKNGSVSGYSNPNLSPRNGETASKDKGPAFLESTPKGSVGPNDNVIDRITKLENELFDYQYNMGLLLIEKKEWTSNCEEIKQALEETKDALKRDQTAHLIAISEVEKREENLRKALGVERQCVLELEKALRDIRSENAEIKFTSDSKLAEANGLLTSVEDKSLEVELKLRAAEAKLAEVSRRTSEIERKSHEVEAAESSLRRERASFIAEREAHERNLFNQKEDLREWERKLQEGEERLAEVRRLLNQREERANENDRIYEQKQIDLENAQKRIDAANLSLKEKEDDMSSRIANLKLKEKEADAIKNSLDVKEKELLELEQKLSAREQVEIQKLLDEHKIILDKKKHDFELEMEQKMKTLDEDFKSKVAEVEKKEVEVNHMEGKISKREQALEKKLEKSKEKEKDLDMKLKTLKEREKSLKLAEKNLENERRQLLTERENFLSLKAELEKVRSNIEEQRLKINEEREQLQVTEEERSELTRLQSELKQEIDKCRLQRELLLKEGDDLKHERERFEIEWEELDEKRTQIKKETESVTEQKEKMEKFNRLEEERLNNQRLETQAYVERELEELKLAKDSFAASMEQERSAMAEKYQSEKSQMLHDFELRKRELETEMQNREEEMENQLCQREKSFEEERERELNNIKYLKEVASREMEEMKLERLGLEKEKQDLSANQKHLEGQQLEMRKDIDELVGLSMKLKEQREQFFRERERFIAFVDKHKGCKNCGEITSEFVLSDLQSLAEASNGETFAIPKLADDYLKEAVLGTSERPNGETSLGGANSGSPASGRTVSWLRECVSKISIFSPVKKTGIDEPQSMTGAASVIEKDTIVEEDTINEEPPKILLSYEDEPELSGRIATDSFDVQRTLSDNSIGEGPKTSKRGGRARVNRRQRVKTVVGDPKAVPGDSREHKESEHSNGITENSIQTNEDSRGESDHLGKRTQRDGKKRNRTRDEDPDYNEGHSDSVTTGGRRKRRQKVEPALQAPAEKRYNLRPPKTAGPVVANGALLDAAPAPAPAPATKVQNEDVKAFNNSKDVHDDSVNEVARNETAADSQNEVADTAAQVDKNMVLSEEVNGTPERAVDYDHEERWTENHGEDDDETDEDEDEDEEEAEHPGEVSIGRKLWKFIST